MAKSIEERLPDILGFTGRLGRQECAVQGINTSTGFRPSLCDVDRLYPEFGALVRRKLRRWFDDDDLKMVAGKRWQGDTQEQPRQTNRRRSIAACESIWVV